MSDFGVYINEQSSESDKMAMAFKKHLIDAHNDFYIKNEEKIISQDMNIGNIILDVMLSFIFDILTNFIRVNKCSDSDIDIIKSVHFKSMEEMFDYFKSQNKNGRSK
jgi:hypothetical protein